MTPSRDTSTQPSGGHGQPSPAHAARVSGDELFVPASHGLITDRQISHPAFRLWCVLHRLWFLHEPPTMELLQELMGTSVEEKHQPGGSVSRARIWQPATRRSIERWLKELECAGWLIWARREDATRRYHLRTSARSAGDSAVLHELRSLLNSGKASLADVQALIGTLPDDIVASPTSPDATLPSHDPIPGSHQDAETIPLPPGDATAESHRAADTFANATAESHHATSGSHETTAESHDTTLGSYAATVESHHATPGSHERLAEGVPTRQIDTPYTEIPQNQIRRDPTPPPAAPDGDDGGPTLTERYLLRQGFSARAAREFRALDHRAVQADLERRRDLGQGIGAVVTTWRIEPPHPASAELSETPAMARRAANAKAQALAIAPPDANPIEIQYLAFDLEEGTPPAHALARLSERRTQGIVGGGV